MTAVDLLKLIGAEIGREERLPPEYGVLEYDISMRGSWYVRFEDKTCCWMASREEAAASAVKALGWELIAHRLAARIVHLRGVLDDLEVQSTPGITNGWVCVSAVEWEQAMKRAVEMPGADPSRYERSAP